MKIVVTLSYLLLWFSMNAQSDSSWSKKPEIHLQEFLDVYYAYDFNKPETVQRQSFFFNHNRHNEFNLNLGLIKVGITHQKYRANLGLQVGTYVTDNYAAEPTLNKFISEANIGILLSRKRNVWVDAGIFSSHIGFESAISSDNQTLTRSLLAENSPYFLTGVKFTAKPSEKLVLSGLIVNGWQRIQRLQGNSLLSFGTQVIYNPNKKIAFNWSTFIGTDDPDSTRRMRYFNNLYTQLSPSKRVKMTVGFDVGIQQQSKYSDKYDYWFSPVFITQFQLSTKWYTTLRLESYEDKHNLIISTVNQQPFQTCGLSLNFDYLPIENIKIRIEGRWLQSSKNIFTNEMDFTNQNIFICSSIAINLSQLISKVDSQ